MWLNLNEDSQDEIVPNDAVGLGPQESLDAYASSKKPSVVCGAGGGDAADAADAVPVVAPAAG